MEEGTPELSFGRTDHLYSITKGYVIVKKNILTGSIKAKGSFDDEVVRGKTAKIMELTNEQLADLLTRAQNKGRLNDVSVFQAEIDRRNAGDPPIVGISDRAVKIPGKSDFIRRRINAKLGIKFRWPWQSVLVLPTTDRKIDTPIMTVDTAEKIRLQFDTDYHYKIIDPEAFATEFNSREEQYGANALSMIEKYIGDILDQLVRSYMAANLANVQDKPSVNLLSVLGYEVAKETQKYGIEVTSLLVKDIKLPDNVVQAEAEKKAANARAEAARRQQEVEASKEAMEKLAMINTLKQAFPNLSDDAIMQYYTQIIAAGTVRTNINAGGFPPIIQHQPVGQPVGQTAEQQPVQQQQTAEQQPAQQQQTAGQQPVDQQRPANAPEWFDEYVDVLYDGSGRIFTEVWDIFKQNNPGVPPFPPKVTIMSQDLFDQLCNDLGYNPPTRGQQI